MMRDGDVTTWRDMLADELKKHDETTQDIFVAGQVGVLDIEWRFCFCESPPFTAWSATRVYFPTSYDNAEGVASVPRHPCDEATEHQP